ncbi:carboxyltransferase domain-containing protein [Staphylococcus coagulans]|uniref:Carboxyltransferase domain-containing protein n=1 Tax=Staphylococcus coagulans TaxID=74706 RepID=A0ABU1EXI5_9STAP|nr:carboxyltransferase domain-containing protein [Staphylococcus coagulans]MDR5602830.1 carboxyltransferase domain-containing protein [Staphylococcus coagulans]MDR9832340.1 carboxyltransferase domain-containing protein [Staphylococcus coagulans]
MKVYSQGDQAIVVSLKGAVTPTATQRLLMIRNYLVAQNYPYITEIVPTETDMLISYDAYMMMRHLKIASPFLHMKSLIEHIDISDAVFEKQQRCIKVPVEYGGIHGFHFDKILAELNMDAQTFIQLHTESDYFVSMMGYSPAFPYLTGVDPRIIVNHMANEPRVIPAGSIIMENNKCGITTTETYGDWLVIGRTPLQLFQPNKKDFARISLGDQVKFTVVSQGGDV